MKPRIVSNQAAWITGLALAGLAFTISVVPAAKPLPPPTKPAAIVYSNVGVGVCGMAADGTSKRVLVADSGKIAHRYPTISPDGTTLAILRYPSTTPSSTTPPELCLAKIDGTGLRVVRSFAATDPVPARYPHLMWSPDGTKVLFNSESGKGLYCVALSNPTVIQPLFIEPPPPPPPDYGSNFTGPFALSKDLDPLMPGWQCKIAFGGSPYGASRKFAFVDVTFDLTGGILVGEDITYIELDDAVYALSWSPNGGSLAYSCMDHESGILEINLLQLAFDGLDLVGCRVTCVAQNITLNSRIAWSPDGQYLVHTSGWDIISARVNIGEGGEGLPYLDQVTNLTNTPATSNPQGPVEWHPDWSPTWTPGQ